jgi:glucose-fructose oxidoreductase
MRSIRYAVVGLGHIAQVAVLPAFRHATRNSRLTALVSRDATKLKKVAKTYRLPQAHTFSYDEYDACLRSGFVDAVYIALPNSMHAEYAIRAAKAGVHVLCEKPMAVTERECEAMIRAARDHRVKLMIAYRLHLEEANLRAVEIVKSGSLGNPRIFTSVFGMQVRKGNIRTQQELGGGTLYDLGIYCINGARYLFRAEPREVSAYSARNHDPRFKEIDEMTTAVLRFPKDRVAVFTSSFGSGDVGFYQVVGTKGDLRVDPSYEYAEGLRHFLTIDGRTRSRAFPKRDQFAPELLYFSDCIIGDIDPEPSGADGLADVRVIRALYRSARLGRPVKITPRAPRKRPTPRQRIRRPAVTKPTVVRVKSAGRK